MLTQRGICWLAGLQISKAGRARSRALGTAAKAKSWETQKGAGVVSFPQSYRNAIATPRQQRSPIFSSHAIAPASACYRSLRQRMQRQSQILPCNIWLYLSNWMSLRRAITSWNEWMLGCAWVSNPWVCVILHIFSKWSQSDHSFKAVTLNNLVCWSLLPKVRNRRSPSWSGAGATCLTKALLCFEPCQYLIWKLSQCFYTWGTLCMTVLDMSLMT